MRWFTMPNPRISYFIGALQSDGTFYIFKNKKRHTNVYRIRFQVGEKSLPMLKYLQQIFATELDRKLKINLDKVNEYGTKIYSLGTSVNTILPKLKRLNIQKNKIPKTIITNKKHFCAYLAGLIDGDGDICIKRPLYPQCAVRITSEKPLRKLCQLIKYHLACSARIEKVHVNSIIEGRRIVGAGYKNAFYLSSKNLSAFSRFVYPHIQIKHKRKTLQKFFKIQANRNS